MFDDGEAMNERAVRYQGPFSDRFPLVGRRSIPTHLKVYFPPVLEWFDGIGSSIAADFLVRPSLESLQRARSSTIERFFVDHNSRNMERIRERLKQIRKAVRVDK